MHFEMSEIPFVLLAVSMLKTLNHKFSQKIVSNCQEVLQTRCIA